jgi:hypothetical protein
VILCANTTYALKIYSDTTTRSRWKLKQIHASFDHLASRMQDIQYSGIVDYNTNDCFSLMHAQELLDCLCFTDIQYLHIHFQISQFTFIGTQSPTVPTVYQRIWMSNQSIVFTFIVPWYLVTRLGKFIKLYVCFTLNYSDVSVSLLDSYLAQAIVINGW